MLSVLIVDDDELLCESMRRRIEQYGFIVFVATTAIHAADIVSKNTIHVAIIDWSLGGSMTGIQLGRALRKQGLATFLISGFSTEEIRAEWRDPLEGFLQFYSKGEPDFFTRMLTDLERVERSLEGTEP